MKHGFSLIELLVVVAIIAMLVGVAAPYYSDYLKESKYAKAKADLDVLKQAVTLHNSREDLPYQGLLASIPPYVPLLGENDFSGLQGRLLTNVPLDPWGKNYKLDPYGGFVYSDGPDSGKTTDDVREYYIKELALSRIEWEDINNNRVMDSPDKLYFSFNKPLWVQGGMSPADFDIFENNILQNTSSATLNFTYSPSDPGNPTNWDVATTSVLVANVTNGTTAKVGVHSLALKDEANVGGVLWKYREVLADRSRCTPTAVFTRVDLVGGNPIRFIVRTHPIKIIPKN